MQRARGPAVRIDIRVFGQRLDQTDLVVGVENGEVRAESRRLRVAPQHACRKRVKGADPEAVHGIADQPGDPVAHLARRLVGKGHGEDLAWPGLPRHRDMSEPRRQYPGLARTGSGQHEERPLRGLDSLALLVVEGVEIGRARGGSDQVSRHGPSYQPGRPGCGRFATAARRCPARLPFPYIRSEPQNGVAAMTRRRAQYFLRNAAVSALFSALAAGAVAAAEPPSAPNPLAAVVALESRVPAEARTAAALGTKRQGSGVVIDDAGLVLTIGYLILEAESIELSVGESRRVFADVLAYDHETGLGLVRASPSAGRGAHPHRLVRSAGPRPPGRGGERRRAPRGDRRLCRFAAGVRGLVGISAGKGDFHRARASQFRRCRADRRGRKAGRRGLVAGARRGGGKPAARRQHVRADRQPQADPRRSDRRGPRRPAVPAVARPLPAGNPRQAVRRPRPARRAPPTGPGSSPAISCSAWPARRSPPCRATTGPCGAWVRPASRCRSTCCAATGRPTSRSARSTA